MREMKTIKKTIAALTISMFLLVGSTFANDGIIILGMKSGSTPKKTDSTLTQPCETNPVLNATGIIILGFTGIIVTDFMSCSATTTERSKTGIIILG